MVCIADLCQMAVKDLVVFGEKEFRFAEGHEIFCRGAIDRHMCEIIFRHGGTPMDDVFFVFFVKENFGCPQTAEIIASHVDEFFFGKMHEIIRFPHPQTLTA